MPKIISMNRGVATRRIHPLRKRVKEPPTTTAGNLQPHFRFMDLPTEVQLIHLLNTQSWAQRVELNQARCF
jgi:hypothetical protein